MRSAGTRPRECGGGGGAVSWCEELTVEEVRLELDLVELELCTLRLFESGEPAQHNQCS